MCAVRVSVLGLQVSMRDDYELLYFTLLFRKKSFLNRIFYKSIVGGFALVLY